MIPWKEITLLKNQAADFKVQGNFLGVLPLREKVARLFEENGGSAKDIANSWNYVAYVNRQLKDFPAAERTARHSLSYYLEHFPGKDELLATYLDMLTVILRDQNRFAEALPHMEEAVEIFAAHQGESAWVLAQRADLEEIRQQVWRG